MWPELTGSPVRGCNQVVLRVRSLRGRSGKHAPVSDGGRGAARAGGGRERGRAAPRAPPRGAPLLDEEDAPVPADAVGPVLRRKQEARKAASVRRERTLLYCTPVSDNTAGAGAGKECKSQTTPQLLPLTPVPTSSACLQKL